jgi:hypothetical protein
MGNVAARGSRSGRGSGLRGDEMVREMREERKRAVGNNILSRGFLEETDNHRRGFGQSRMNRSLTYREGCGRWYPF